MEKLMKAFTRNNDPLASLFMEYGYEPDLIKALVTGKRYTAVMLKNGNIGVCANLWCKVDTKNYNADLNHLNKTPERIIYNAYLNALLNNSGKEYQKGDIHDVVQADSSSGKIVMIGYFNSVLEKYKSENIALDVYDINKNGVDIKPENQKLASLTAADIIILTSTSVFNGTFGQLVGSAGEAASIYMLGPSSVMDMYFKRFQQIRMILGTCFKPYDNRILDIIENDGGTRDFQKLGTKVVYKIN